MLSLRWFLLTQGARLKLSHVTDASLCFVMASVVIHCLCRRTRLSFPCKMFAFIFNFVVLRFRIPIFWLLLARMIVNWITRMCWIVKLALRRSEFNEQILFWDLCAFVPRDLVGLMRLCHAQSRVFIVVYFQVHPVVWTSNFNGCLCHL